MNIPFQQTPNYKKGDGTRKIGHVFHGTLGSFEGAKSWLMNPNRPNRTSAHFLVGRERGQIVQLVRTEDEAWHAGNIKNPSDRAKKLLPKTVFGTYRNPNKYLIGTELVWGYDIDRDGTIEPNEKDLTDWQYECLEWITSNFSAPYSKDKNLSHQEIADYKGDDMLFAIEELDRRMNGIRTVPVAKPGVIPPQPLSFYEAMLKAGFIIKDGKFIYTK